MLNHIVTAALIAVICSATVQAAGPTYADPAKTDADFDPIRDHPEFRRLVYEES